jgi:predicted DNA-binding transcriptional regulator AlpA
MENLIEIEKELLSVKETCKMLGITRQTLRNTQKLCSVKVGIRGVRYPKKNIEAYLNGK